MSALNAAAAASAIFNYQGASVTLSCSSATELLSALREFGVGPAANDSTAAPGKSKPANAATAPAGAPAAQTTASSAPPAAAPAAQGEAGNGAGAPSGAASAPPASSGTPAASPEVSFDEVKKAFLALATKPNGRALCEEVNKKFGVAKLSDNKPENYAAVLAEIKAKAGA